MFLIILQKKYIVENSRIISWEPTRTQIDQNKEMNLDTYKINVLPSMTKPYPTFGVLVKHDRDLDYIRSKSACLVTVVADQSYYTQISGSQSAVVSLMLIILSTILAIKFNIQN